MPEHDVVIIGAGHNGLVAGCYLVDAGLDVVVVEANARVGGMTTSQPAGEGDLADYIFHKCAVDPLLWNLYPPSQELSLDRYGLRPLPVDPVYVYLDPDGGSIAFWSDRQKTADEFRRFSAADASAFLELSELLDGLFEVFFAFAATNPTRPDLRALAKAGWGAIRHRARLGEFAAFALSSGLEVINERFEHPVSRAALYVLACQGLAPPSAAMTAIGLISIPVFHTGTAIRTIGGIQAIPEALSKRLAARGGTVLTDCPVQDILMSAGRAAGVRLADGRELRARVGVLATCDPRSTLEGMLPAGSLPAPLDRRVRGIPNGLAGYGQMSVNVACGGRLDMSRHNGWRRDGLDLRIPSHVIGTPTGIERAYAASLDGRMPEPADIPLISVIPTGLDPSQAPEGTDTLYLYSPSVPARPTDGWETLRASAGDAVMKQAAQYYGGLGEVAIHRDVHTPVDIAREHRVTGGTVTHVDWLPSRAGPLRPALGLGGFRTPIEGLYLGGAGSHPGGAVTGAPGWLAAREVMRARRRTRTLTRRKD